jgi:crotonobetainyl-CoA:carnitine CoA-transferase CaiB-like acyl-CoA transferase
VPRLSETPGSLDRLGPAPGAHDAQVYGSLPGMTGADLEALRSAKVI